MTQQYGNHISWGPYSCKTTIILLINVNTSVSSANVGQHQQMLLRFYNISTQDLRSSARVRVQERTKSVHPLVDRPFSKIPRPLRVVTSRAPRGVGTAQIAHSTRYRTPQQRSYDRKGGR